MDATCFAHTSNSLSFESTQFSSALTVLCIIFSFINEIRASVSNHFPRINQVSRIKEFYPIFADVFSESRRFRAYSLSQHAIVSLSHICINMREEKRGFLERKEGFGR